MRVLESKCTERLVRGEFNESWEVKRGLVGGIRVTGACLDRRNVADERKNGILQDLHLWLSLNLYL